MIFKSTASAPRQLTSRLFTRSYANRRPVKPPPKIRDPLQADNALATPIDDGNSSYTFVHRPPPTAPSPHSTVAAPASPLLHPPSSSANASFVPPLVRVEPTGHRVLSEAEIDQVRALRDGDPVKYSAGKLARQFGCSSKFIRLVAPLSTDVKTSRLEQRNKEHASIRETWGERKRLVHEIRDKRKAFW